MESTTKTTTPGLLSVATVDSLSGVNIPLDELTLYIDTVLLPLLDTNAYLPDGSKNHSIRIISVAMVDSLSGANIPLDELNYTLLQYDYHN